MAHPEAFRVLAALLAALDAYAKSASARDLPFEPAALELPAELVAPALTALTALDVAAAARHAARHVGGASLRRRLHTWFDALKTLRFLHALRAAGLSDWPYDEALAQAPFTPGAAGPTLEHSLRRVAELELALPTQQGPARRGFSVE